MEKYNKDITAVIPVREGSTRLKNKNVAPFAGTNLLINKINQLKEVKEISRIVVSSDSDMMLAMAKEHIFLDVIIPGVTITFYTSCITTRIITDAIQFFEW